MPRIPRKPTHSTVTVRAVQNASARTLITTADPPAADAVFAVPPIVRVKPEQEHDDEHVRNVRETWEERGAHVRVLPRERVVVEAVRRDVAEPLDSAPRVVVLEVAREVKTDTMDALVRALERTMNRVGL